MVLKLCKIDDLLRSDHLYLTEADQCFFFREYTANKDYDYSDYSETNSLIWNFKKRLDKKGTSEWKYKEKAIKQIAEEFRESLKAKWFEKYTLVPIPPSKSKEDPLYDDRAEEFRESLKAKWFEKYTLVPIPPSKSKEDPLYDDRMVQVLKIFGQGLNLDIRELILQRESTQPFHQITPRPS